jgi:hypothetical protein
MQLFDRYQWTGLTEFTIEVKTLLDVLKIFIAIDVGGIQMQYPGPNQELMLKSYIHQQHDTMVSQGPTQEASLLPTAFAKIETLVYTASTNLLNYFQEPSSSILCSGSTLKDAIEDLDVGGKDVLIEMKDHPQQLTLSSVTTDIEVYVDVPIESLTSFNCILPIVESRYSLKYLVNALSVSPGTKPSEQYGSDGHLCKVAIDAEGLMKVTHMWKMAPGDIARREQEDTGEDGSKQTMVVTQYVILPMAVMEEEEQDAMSSRAM